MSIHSEHPFAVPGSQRSPARRLRGRLAAPITVIAAGEGRGRVGLTVSSVQLADGEVPRLVALVDPDSDLSDAVGPGGVLAVTVLHDGDQFLAEVFAGLAPAPGGTFTVGRWRQTPWGPVLADHAWVGAVLEREDRIGWSRQLVAVVEFIDLGSDAGLEPLIHLRGGTRPAAGTDR